MSRLKIGLSVIFCLLAAASLSLAATNEESITITTYYPSPYGVYKTLRLYPNTDVALAPDAPCSNAGEGEMSYDSDTKQVLVCAEDVPGIYKWRIGSGFGASGQWGMYIDPATRQFRFQRNGEDKLTIDPYSGGIAIPRIHLILPSYVPPGSSGSPEVIFRYDPSTSPAKDWKIYVDMNDANKFKVQDSPFALSRITIDTAGNVGIGTTNPQSTLQVASGYIQFPFVTAVPAPTECDAAAEAGRVVVFANTVASGDAQLYVCDWNGISGAWTMK